MTIKLNGIWEARRLAAMLAVARLEGAHSAWRQDLLNRILAQIDEAEAKRKERK